MSKLKLPTRTERKLIEHKGRYEEVEIEDRPFRRVHKFNEDKGRNETVDEPLTDLEILEAGGIKRFFTDTGKRRKGSWPYDPDKKPGTRRDRKKKGAKKKK